MRNVSIYHATFASFSLPIFCPCLMLVHEDNYRISRLKISVTFIVTFNAKFSAKGSPVFHKICGMYDVPHLVLV